MYQILVLPTVGTWDFNSKRVGSVFAAYVCMIQVCQEPVGCDWCMCTTLGGIIVCSHLSPTSRNTSGKCSFINKLFYSSQVPLRWWKYLATPYHPLRATSQMYLCSFLFNLYLTRYAIWEQVIFYNYVLAKIKQSSATKTTTQSYTWDKQTHSQ